MPATTCGSPPARSPPAAPSVFLIPPSVMLIVYAAVAGQSIVKLYAAAMLPGFFLTFLYLVYILGWALINPKIAPKLAPDQYRIDAPEWLRQLERRVIEAGVWRLLVAALFRARVCFMARAGLNGKPLGYGGDCQEFSRAHGTGDPDGWHVRCGLVVCHDLQRAGSWRSAVAVTPQGRGRPPADNGASHRFVGTPREPGSAEEKTTGGSAPAEDDLLSTTETRLSLPRHRPSQMGSLPRTEGRSGGREKSRNTSMSGSGD